MTIANGLTLPVSLADGTPAEAPDVMSDFNTLLAALNRALLDTGGGAGMNAQNTGIHNLTDGALAQDAAAFHQIADAIGALAPLASPHLTGVPTAPTAVVGTNTTQLATTAFIIAQIAAGAFAPLASPGLTGNPTAPTQAGGNNSTRLATTAFVTAALAGALKIKAISFANPGYVQLSDGTNGFMAAFGRVTAIGNTNTPVAYPVAFATSAYPVCSGGGSGTLNNSTNYPSVESGSETTAGFSIANNIGVSYGTNWIAVGDCAP